LVQVELELVEAVARGLKSESPGRVKEILEGLVPGLLETLGGGPPHGGFAPGKHQLQRAAQLLNRLQAVLKMVSCSPVQREQFSSFVLNGERNSLREVPPTYLGSSYRWKIFLKSRTINPPNNPKSAVPPWSWMLCFLLQKS